MSNYMYASLPFEEYQMNIFSLSLIQIIKEHKGLKPCKKLNYNHQRSNSSTPFLFGTNYKFVRTTSKHPPPPTRTKVKVKLYKVSD